MVIYLACDFFSPGKRKSHRQRNVVAKIRSAENGGGWGYLMQIEPAPRPPSSSPHLLAC